MTGTRTGKALLFNVILIRFLPNGMISVATFNVRLPEIYVEQLIIKALKCQDICLGYTSIFHGLDSLCEQNQNCRLQFHQSDTFC